MYAAEPGQFEIGIEAEDTSNPKYFWLGLINSGSLHAGRKI